MLCLYLLGLPDHYTPERFKVFTWAVYQRVVADVWSPEESTADECDADVDGRPDDAGPPEWLCLQRRVSSVGCIDRYAVSMC